MDIFLQREPSDDACTIGTLKVSGTSFVCYTLEDVVRVEKIYGQTAIPEGRYEITITWSGHFSRLLPLLVSVPNYEGVRIHPGNTAADTEGCILVGEGLGVDRITESRVSFNKLYTLIETCIANGEKVYITIANA